MFAPQKMKGILQGSFIGLKLKVKNLKLFLQI